MTNFITLIICLLLLTECASQCVASDSSKGLWDMNELRVAPKFEVVERTGNLCSIYYDGIPYQGKPTRIFAYLAYPEGVKGKAPVIALVHGGLGQAYPDWAKMWAARGYIALAMDVFGQGPDGKHMEGSGPDQGPIFAAEAKDSWTYSAVATVIEGISLLQSLPEADPKRVGLTGVSWGGYLTCITAGVDDRIKAAAPIYGCGFLHEASIWSASIQGLPEPQKRTWIESLDPSVYLPHAKMPMHFLNGTNDHCFWLDSYKKSYKLVRNRVVSLIVELPHGQQISSAVEPAIFMDQYLKGGKPLVKLGKMNRKGNQVEVRFKSPVELHKAELNFTTDTGLWENRKWQTHEAKIDGQTIRAELPTDRPIAYYIAVTDNRDAVVSTEHEILTQ